MADSGLPTGAYVYSSGLESAAKMGLFPSRADFAAYWQSVLQSVATPVIASCYRLTDPLTGRDLQTMVVEYDAATPIPSLRPASITHGETWLLKEACPCIAQSPSGWRCDWRAPHYRQRLISIGPADSATKSQ